MFAYVIQHILNICEIIWSCQFYPEIVKFGETMKSWICGHLHFWQKGRFGRAVVSSLFSLEAAMKLEENLNIRIWERALCFGFLIGICHKSHLYGPLRFFFFFFLSFEGSVNLARLNNGALSDLTSKTVVWRAVFYWNAISAACIATSVMLAQFFEGPVQWKRLRKWSSWKIGWFRGNKKKKVSCRVVEAASWE